jgi:alpha-beta hydrolase superfamily lysophospholipase
VRALYFDVRGEPAIGLFHPASGTAGPSVLICPPFGREDATSYRSRRWWAESLADAGMPALRFDLPGTGDSGGGIGAPGRLESWLAAVDAAARLLHAETGRARTAAIGIGLGGMLAVAALEAGAPIDDLVLWGAPASGRALVRELAMFARIESESIVVAGGTPPPPGSPATLAPGGFPLPDELLESLGELDLATLQLPPVEGRRALLLARDGIAPDAELHKAFEENDVQVDVADGNGYGAMMTVLPEEARLPEAVRECVESWLQTRATHTRKPRGAAAPAVSTSADLTTEAGRVRETPHEADHSSGRLFGILAEPVEVPSTGLGLVLLNAGAIRRSGPSRLWVELARRWAAQGVPTLRVDLDGIGDASGNSDSTGLAALYAEGHVDQVKAALDALTARVDPDRVALLGLCAGAYWGFHTALVDDRVSLVVMLNPRLLFWDAEIVEGRDARRRRRRIFQASAWRELWRAPWWSVPARILTRAGLVAAEPLRSLTRRRADAAARTSAASAFDRLAASRTRAVFAFCDGEPLHDDLVADGVFDQHDRWPQLELIQLPGRDHVLRPLWMHEHVDEAVDRVLADELLRNSYGSATA